MRANRPRPALATALFPHLADRALTDTDASVRLVHRYLEQSPMPTAVVSGSSHLVAYANAAFRKLSGSAGHYAGIGDPVTETLPAEARADLAAVLDRVRLDGITVHGAAVGLTRGGTAQRDAAAWLCDVWPVVEDLDRSDCLVVALRSTTRGEGKTVRHRAIAERLLFTALREQELAQRADNSRARAVFLAEASRRLGGSLELETVYSAIANVALPEPGAWCIVDVLQPNGSWRRLTIVHPDPLKQALVSELHGHWSPAPGDPIGAPLVANSRETMAVAQAEAEAALAAAAHGQDNLRILRALGVGPLLVVPLIAHDRFRGAITFVGPSGTAPYSEDDVQLAEDLADRCADLLDGARLYEDARQAQIGADAARALADTARKDAERANQAKTSFLTSMSHELRTPLNAVLGYTELLLMGIRGPVSVDQVDALTRIRRASTHLLGLINDVLNVARLKAFRIRFVVTDVPVSELLDSAGSMIEPQAVAKGVGFACASCGGDLTVRGDREKVLQILLNLLSNAVKFTAAGGRITLGAVLHDRRRRAEDANPEAPSPTAPSVQFKVQDTGRGLDPEQIKTIFEPFVQVGRPLDGADEGSGLGLAISRDLARGMGGDLTVESTLGVGSTFTLTVPCAAPG